MSKQHTTPCSQCPFRRTALRGFVGGHESITEIIDLVMQDGRFPCHMAVSADLEVDFPTAVARAPLCAGALAMMNNTCKDSRDPEVSAAQDLVGERKDVFRDANETQLYHSPGAGPYVPYWQRELLASIAADKTKRAKRKLKKVRKRRKAVPYITVNTRGCTEPLDGKTVEALHQALTTIHRKLSRKMKGRSK